jgi:transcriptional regulator with PAS, ATPase and Fis domain
VPAFERFSQNFNAYLPRRFSNPDDEGPPLLDKDHLFALLFQLRRGFELIYQSIIGTSKAARTLRADLWQSVFTVDMRRYERSLYRRMHEIHTLVLGPSGTGKELVARSVGMSRYLSFNSETGRFVEEVADSFHSLNISALSPTLVESELFGHSRGAFTGATSDRVGWLESCPLHGTVFLDEIGELDTVIQVKLLRVIQAREFQRVGETETRPFSGKLVSATNRDLGVEMQKGRFREDFYYRLCADIVQTPSLRLQLADSPEDLELLVGHIAARLVEPDEVEDVQQHTCAVIEKSLGRSYAWPGNIRELEQCVRSILVRGRYEPASMAPTQSDGRSALAQSFLSGEFNADELLDVYITLLFERTQSYSDVGRRLGIDRRTVKARVNPKLLDRFEN